MLSRSSITSLVTILAALSGQALSAPSVSHRTCKAGTQTVANFDDQNYVLGTVAPALQAVGTYEGLKYNGFVGFLAPPALGITPHSSPNVIVTGLPQSLLDGTASIQATGDTAYFDLKSFYFGCALDTVTGAVGVPIGCTITVKGFYQGTEQIVQEFDYSPTDLFSKSLDKASTKLAACHTGFKGVDKVEFTTNNAVLPVLILDDIKYIPHTCSS